MGAGGERKLFKFRKMFLTHEFSSTGYVRHTCRDETTKTTFSRGGYRDSLGKATKEKRISCVYHLLS